MTRHKIDAVRSGTVNGQDFEEEYVITFSFTPGTSASWDDPGSGDLVEFEKVEPPVPTDGSCPHPDLLQKQINQWAEEWLEDNHDEAVVIANYDRDAGADDYADFLRRQRIDDRITGDR